MTASGRAPIVKTSRKDSAHAGRRALVWLDRRWVIVALDANRDGDAVAGVDHPGVLPRTDEHVRRRRSGSRRR